MRFMKVVFNDRPTIKLRADWNKRALLFSRFMSLTTARLMLGLAAKAEISPDNFIAALAAEPTGADRARSIPDVKIIFDNDKATEYGSYGDQRKSFVLEVSRSHAATAYAARRTPVAEAVAAADRFKPATTADLTSGMDLTTGETLVKTVFNHGPFTIFRSDRNQFGGSFSRLRTAVHADLRNQVVFHLALHG
jgi:hypothetical protein